jgi:nitrate reductase beta subunit
MLARRVAWTGEQVIAIADGRSSGDTKVDALLKVVREAVRADGTVSDTAWAAAVEAGWTSAELAETYGYLALVAYCDRFVRYARTEFDLAFATIAS